jgi:hypothetical protein
VRIDLQSAAAPEILHVSEVQLMLNDGTSITPDNIVLSSVSKTEDGVYQVKYKCIDGDPETWCETANGDLAPSLDISYSCKHNVRFVVITNRNTCGHGYEVSYCNERITKFQLSFLDDSGAHRISGSPFLFKDQGNSLISFTFPPGEKEDPLRCIQAYIPTGRRMLFGILCILGLLAASLLVLCKGSDRYSRSR